MGSFTVTWGKLETCENTVLDTMNRGTLGYSGRTDLNADSAISSYLRAGLSLTSIRSPAPGRLIKAPKGKLCPSCRHYAGFERDLNEAHGVTWRCRGCSNPWPTHEVIEQFEHTGQTRETQSATRTRYLDIGLALDELDIWERRVLIGYSVLPAENGVRREVIVQRWLRFEYRKRLSRRQILAVRMSGRRKLSETLLRRGVMK